MTEKKPGVGMRMRIKQVLRKLGPLDETGLCEQLAAEFEERNVKHEVYAMLHIQSPEIGRAEDGSLNLLQGAAVDAEGGAAPDSSGGETPAGEKTEPKGKSLDPRSQFIELLKSVGVQDNVRPTIATYFCDGDVDSLPWLDRVLTQVSAGYVSKQQARLIRAVWAQKRNLPYDPAAWNDLAADKGATPKGLPDPGVGWRIGKDKDGEWVAMPGGQLNYQEALEKAAVRQSLAAYGGAGAVPAEEEGEETAEEGAPRRKAKPRESMTEYWMRKMIDKMVDGDGKKGDEDNPVVAQLIEQNRLLQQSLAKMEKDREDERLQRIEGVLAEVAARDPMDALEQYNERRRRLGLDRPTVTDSSPAVQLLKDSTDKAERNITRLLGMGERLLLREGAFVPEEKRSPQEKEKMAKGLVNEMRNRDEAIAARKKAFGV